MSHEHRLALTINILVNTSIPLSGLTGILMYSTSFFRQSGLSCRDSSLTTIGIGVLVIVMAISITPVINRMRRRLLYLVSMAGVILSSGMVTLTLVIQGRINFCEHSFSAKLFSGQQF